jgi:hypothetical protein
MDRKHKIYTVLFVILVVIDSYINTIIIEWFK